MGININEDRMIAEQESRHIAERGESFGVSSMRESLRKLSHIPYYKLAFDRFIVKHGERPF